MRQAQVFKHDILAGQLTETDEGDYIFEYDPHYDGHPISLTMPVKQQRFTYTHFPPFFDGLLPEGRMLSALLTLEKLDRDDHFGCLIQVGGDLVGSVTVKACT